MASYRRCAGGIGAAWPRSFGRTGNSMLAAWFRGALDPDLDRMLRDEVDDLAKFNLLHFLHRSHGLCADAASLARALGFHSVELTERKLRQLVACGLVRAEPASDDGRALYSLAADEAVRRRLAKLWRL